MSGGEWGGGGGVMALGRGRSHALGAATQALKPCDTAVSSSVIHLHRLSHQPHVLSQGAKWIVRGRGLGQRLVGAPPPA